MHYQTQELPKGLSVAALVLGIVGLVMAVIPWCNWIIAIPCCILAIIFGAIARTRAREGAYGGEQQANAGMICGIIGAVIIVIWIIFIAISATMFTNYMMDFYYE